MTHQRIKNGAIFFFSFFFFFEPVLVPGVVYEPTSACREEIMSDSSEKEKQKT